MAGVPQIRQMFNEEGSNVTLYWSMFLEKKSNVRKIFAISRLNWIVITLFNNFLHTVGEEL